MVHIKKKKKKKIFKINKQIKPIYLPDSNLSTKEIKVYPQCLSYLPSGQPFQGILRQ